MNIKSQNKGFTLIETLVAIAVLMIAIAGPLVIANQALTSALYARDQSTASFLAQEEMEIVKNVRDNVFNNSSGQTIPGVFSPCMGSSSTCDIEALNDYIINIIIANLVSPNYKCSSPSSNSCLLYLDSNNKYTHSSTGTTPTKFTRSFYLMRPDNGSTDDYQVIVNVSWKEGNIPNGITLSGVLANYARQ